MRRILKTLVVATLTVAPIALSANTYCDALGDKSLLPPKYAKRGPFHVDVANGWIIGSDQMKGGFTVTDESRALWQEITAVFAAAGIKLSAMVAPPRPLFAPDLGIVAGFDPSKIKAEFSTYIDALNDAGIVAPDLSNLSDASIAPNYYFARDTHWTPQGAAVSVASLAQALVGRAANDILETISFSDSYTEKGSLSTVVEKTCGTRPEKETVAAPAYTQKGSASALLADTSEQAIALVGTSFSDRHQHDAYQVAGAISHALDAPVHNFSVTGGGLVGAMEAFILGGALRSGRYHSVIWEAPYSAPLTNVNGLRQVLGAMQSDGEKEQIFDTNLSSRWVSIEHGFNGTAYQAITIYTPGVSEGKLELELYNSDGEKVRIKLIKSNQIKVSERSETWTASLTALPFTDVTRFKIKVNEDVSGASIYLIK